MPNNLCYYSHPPHSMAIPRHFAHKAGAKRKNKTRYRFSMELHQRLGEKIREARVFEGDNLELEKLNLKDLGDFLGMSPPVISKLEIGNRRSDIVEFWGITHFLRGRSPIFQKFDDLFSELLGLKAEDVFIDPP